MAPLPLTECAHWRKCGARIRIPRERKREMARKISGKRGRAIIALIAVLAALAAAAPASADPGELLYEPPELIASWAEE